MVERVACDRIHCGVFNSASELETRDMLYFDRHNAAQRHFHLDRFGWQTPFRKGRTRKASEY
jgi:hypothetical protein